MGNGPLKLDSITVPACGEPEISGSARSFETPYVESEVQESRSGILLYLEMRPDEGGKS